MSKRSFSLLTDYRGANVIRALIRKERALLYPAIDLRRSSLVQLCPFSSSCWWVPGIGTAGGRGASAAAEHRFGVVCG